MFTIKMAGAELRQRRDGPVVVAEVVLLEESIMWEIEMTPETALAFAHVISASAVDAKCAEIKSRIDDRSAVS